ncbi:NEDD8-activating protein UBA3 Ecym_3471 [Eremothecium cymbalariae DBVPG|uniref:NEDD8-activating enzyme E1 catalytic subunit n=1 Tax=Eremothecium cymbalariae (strain CBS 270.75 / DBVPG 7215 / KCTC 17166 / NRRL Y-17582) TaxID=931890 RepID=G8JS35_ERECY|nr:Hypothetical protein Ecym_3471 [Eremothecium cymbalariae DBVPG\
MTENDQLASCKVIVLGAGGLGCEILKNLAMTGMPVIHVVDMDTIELTNLNRQLLFREDDVGKPKALVAAAYINSLELPSVLGNNRPVKLIPHVCDLTSLPPDFWSQFTAVISGLDAIEPRRHINSLLVNLTMSTNFEKCIPFIDGGSEGLSGHCKTIIPGINACYECSISTLAPPGQTYPLCTIANNPRLPEHIVVYILNVELPLRSAAPNCPLDDPQTIRWLVDRCRSRAATFGMSPDIFDEKYICGVAKNIVPSVVSTNAIIAASCCTELLKLLWDLEDDPENMNNFLLYNGQDGCFTYSFAYHKSIQCNVCRPQ